jgi:hypothetical protein
VQLTRRGFLATSGTSGLGPRVALASRVTLEPIDTFSVRVVRVGRPDWIVDWRQLGSGLSGGITSPKSVTVPGIFRSDIKFVLDLNFSDRWGSDSVEAVWTLMGEQLPPTQAVPIDQILADIPLDAPLAGRTLAAFMTALAGDAFVTPQHAILKLYQRLAVTLWAPPALASAIEPSLRVPGLLLAPAPTVMPAGWRAGAWGEVHPKTLPLGGHDRVSVSVGIDQSTLHLVRGPLPLRLMAS